MSHVQNDSAESSQGGMSTGMKVVVGLGGGCLVLVLLCCGGFIILGITAGPAIEKALEEFTEELEQAIAEGWTEDRREVELATEELADIQIPAALEPTGAFQFGDRTRWVVYEGKKVDATLILMRGKIGPVVLDGDEIVDWIESEVAQNRRGHPDMRIQINEDSEIIIDSSEKREFVVRGESASFVFASGHKDGSDEIYRQIIGSFQGEDAPIFLLLFAEEDALSEEEIIEMIESIQ